MTNLILEKNLLDILKKVQEVINRYLKMISKKEWDLEYINLVKYEIHLEHDWLIKHLVRYVNLRLTD